MQRERGPFDGKREQPVYSLVLKIPNGIERRGVKVRGRVRERDAVRHFGERLWHSELRFWEKENRGLEGTQR